MFHRSLLVILAAALPAAHAFVVYQPASVVTALRADTLGSDATAVDKSVEADIRRELNYQPGAADTEFARRYKHLSGQKFKTVGEAFADFTSTLGYTVNPLYKNMVTDLVGTIHLIMVNARFRKDPIWSLGLMTTCDLLLKNYPEAEMGDKIVSALFTSVGLDEAEVRREAKEVLQWAEGKTRTDVEAALTGEGGDSVISRVASVAKADEFWMYSRYFGIGLLKIMETVGIEMDKDEVYPIMEDWMSNKMGKSHLTACADGDLYFRIKEKLDMMETMMKEIEIREKKRLAERLEEKAEAALRAAEKEKKLEGEIEAEAAKQRERVESS